MANLNRPFTGVLNDLRRRIETNKRYKDDYSDIINVGLGHPALPVDDNLQDALTADIKAADGMARYGSGVGDLSTKKVIADFITKVRKTPYEFDEQCNQVAITFGITGTIKEYFSALYNHPDNTTDCGDSVNHKKINVLIPTPAYAWYFDALKNMAGVKAISVDTSITDWKINAETLRAELAKNPPPDAIILNYPCNPTGTNLSKEEWTQIAEALREYVKEHPKFRIVLDNAYKDLQFGEKTGLFEVAPDLANNGIEFNSVSKYHGYAGRNGPGFAVSQNTTDIAMLKKQLNSDLGVGLAGEEMLRRAFSAEYFTPEKMEAAIGVHRRRCKLVAKYVDEQLAPLAGGSNQKITIDPDGGMFVFANFKPWLNKKINSREAQEYRKILQEIMPENKEYFATEVFKNNTINDDKDLSLYLFFKAHVIMIPGQDFSADPKDGMLRFALGDIGEMTNFFKDKEKISDEKLQAYLPNEDLQGKPLDDLRKLKLAVDRITSTLKEISSERKIG